MLSSRFPIMEVGELCSVGDGAHAKVKRFKEGILYLTSKNIGDGRLNLDKVDYIKPEDYERLFRKDSKTTRRPQTGDILIGIIGTFGNAYCYLGDDHFGISSSVAILRPDRSLLDPSYLFYVVRSKSFKAAHSAYKSGSVQGYTNLPTIRRLPVPVPPLPEQRRIAAVLGALDDKIELNREMNRTLEAMAKAIFKSWFIDFDGHDDLVDSELGPIPRGWETGELKDLLVLKRGFDLPKKNRIPGSCPIFAAGGFNGTHNEAKVKGPGVVTGRSGKLGDVYLIHEDFWPLNTTLWIENYRRADPYFAYHFLRTLQLERFNAGSAVPTLNRNHVHGLPVVLPPQPLISKYRGTIEPLFGRLTRNKKESTTLAALRDALLPKLISGEIRVPEAEDVVEDTVAAGN